MAKNKNMDNLTLEVLAAEAAGQSYGKYKGRQYEQRQKKTTPPPQIAAKKATEKEDPTNG